MKHILTDKKHKRVPSKMNSKRPTPRHIIQKMAEVGERILKEWGTHVNPWLFHFNV